MEILNRDNYVKKIVSYKDKKIIKVLIGLRKSGKTEILKFVMNKYASEGLDIFYFDFNEPLCLEKYRKSLVLYKEITELKKQKEHIYVFIDEVQEMEN
jgi:predicted AAA+ superfamily ATPase